MEDSKCDECQSQNVGFINDDWLCLECGEKMNNKMNNKMNDKQTNREEKI